MTNAMPGVDVRPVDLRELLRIPFTDAQLDAATAPLHPGLIVAGAGSGKTSVIAARVVWLVLTGAVEPDRVLGLTFTNKAAAELAGRVRSALVMAGAAGAAGPGADGEPTVSTYHAYAGRLVTEHGLRLGVEPRARLLADATRFQLAARVLRRHPGRVEALTTPLRMLVGDLVSLESELSEHLVEPAQLQAFDAAWLGELTAELSQQEGRLAAGEKVKGHVDMLRDLIATARERQELAALAAGLRAAKRDLDMVDFGDQVALAARLAETCPEVGQGERDRFGVVLLDEYQDTSVAQRRVLTGLFGGGHPVTAVGDPCQAIYGWRGASVSNLDHFGAHFPCADGAPARRTSLVVNQRSGGRLLSLANSVATSLRARHGLDALTPRPGSHDAGQTLVALHLTADDEVRWVAAELRRTVDEGLATAGGCAVLVRARSDFAALHAAITAVGLPVEVVGLGGLLAVPEVADVVATLEVLDDPTANAALVRLLTGPRWRVGPRDLAALGARAAQLLGEGGADASVAERDALEEAVAGVDPCDVASLAEACERPGPRVSPQARDRLVALATELHQLRRSVDEPLLDLVGRVVDVTGLLVELAATPEAVAGRRRESLAAFLDVVAGFADLDGEQSLPAFLAFLRAAHDHERGLDAVTPVEGRDAVQVLTVHKSKGLEWDVVAVPDLTAKVFPADTLRGRWTTTASVLPGPLRGDAGDQPRALTWDKAALAAYAEECRQHLEREERRLGYVAFTRARHTLLASGHWWGATQRKPRGPSPFLAELKEHAEGGGGTVLRWEPRPAEATNPALVAPQQVPWPSPYEPVAAARRAAAATAVTAGIVAMAAGQRPPPDDLEGMTTDERAELGRLDGDLALLLSEARRAHDPVRAVVLPRTLTASQLLRLATDPDGLASDLARPLPRRPVPQARRGTRFHAWVESLFDQRPLLGPDELPGAQDDGAADDVDLAALQEAFLATRWASRQPFAVEVPFALPLGGRVVRGRIDAVYDLGAGRWEVVDWKTGDEPADPLQLGVYALAWARLQRVDPAAVDALFLQVRSGREVRPRLPAAAEIERLLTG